MQIAIGFWFPFSTVDKVAQSFPTKANGNTLGTQLKTALFGLNKTLTPYLTKPAY